MRKKLVIDLMRERREIAQGVAAEQPLAHVQFCIEVLYERLRHEPDFGPTYLDGLRQARKDLEHLCDLASGNPPDTTKQSRTLREMAASTEFKAVSLALIDKAEKLERQAEGLRYKFSKERLQKGIQ